MQGYVNANLWEITKKKMKKVYIYVSPINLNNEKIEARTFRTPRRVFTDMW